MGRWWVMVVVMVTACSEPAPAAIDAPSSVDARPDATPDAIPDAPPDAPTCPGGALDDDFSTGTACAPWGVTSAAGTVTRANGHLDLGVGPGVDVSCKTTATYGFAGGAAVLVAQPLLDDDDNTTYIEASSAQDRVRLQLVINTFAGRLRMDPAGTSGTGLLYLPAEMRWWRLAATGAHEIRGSYSADGLTWTELGVVATTGSTECMTFAIGAVTTSGSGRVLFDQLRITP